MQNPMKKVPFLLIYSRIFMGIAIALIVVFNTPYASFWIVGLMIAALLTDFFDGVVARRYNVATQKLRVWDSNVDLFFWVVTMISVFYLNMEFFLRNYGWILSVVFLQILCLAVSFAKFKKSIATHALLSKLWAMVLLIFLIDLTLHSTSRIPFMLCVFLGILSRVEILLIILKLKRWTTDVPSIFAVSKINRRPLSCE